MFEPLLPFFPYYLVEVCTPQPEQEQKCGVYMPTDGPKVLMVAKIVAMPYQENQAYSPKLPTEPVSPIVKFPNLKEGDLVLIIKTRGMPFQNMLLMDEAHIVGKYYGMDKDSRGHYYV